MSKRKTKKLKELISFQKKGITPSYSEFGQKTILVLNQKCNRNFSINLDFASYNDLTKKKVASDLVLRHGDILINSTGKGTLGRVAQYFGTAQQVTVDSHMLIMRPTEELDTTFFGYALKQYQEILMSKGIGSSGQEELDKISLNEISISYPSDKEEQKNIAAILTVLDTKISINKKLNDNLEALAQALYDYWFVQFDFPDENGKPYKSSGGKMVWNEELKREIPEGWRIGKLSDIIQANPTEKLGKGVDAPYIAMEALSTTNYLTGAPARKKYAGGMKVRNMDVLIARITPCLENGKTALVHDLNVNEVGFGSTEYIVIRGKHFPLPLFCITLARSPEFRPYAISKMTGTSGRRRLDYKDVETYRLPIPPDEVLRRFESWGNPVLEKMHQQHIQSRALEKQRDFLLPLLMNGQVQLRQ